jgi:dethiobiotin synthetase
MSRKFFITSTGTGIGKTYVTTALIRAARSNGLTVAATKPVISGFDKREFAVSDTGKILAALGEEPSEETIARISPWRYAAPLAPSMAARAEGKTLDCEALFSFSNKMFQEKVDLMLTEGVGGVMVPLDARKTVLDWIAASGAPAVLVVGDYLGAISHTLTAVEVLRIKGIEIAAVVVSAGDGGLFAGTIAELRSWVAPAKVLGLGRGEGGERLLAELTGVSRPCAPEKSGS